jgi:glycosyltransferase involved in cell wall biosynthesis
MGAREHYAVPRALLLSDRLGALYTDFWASSGFRRLAGKAAPQLLRSMAARFHPALTRDLVHSWNWRALAWEAELRFRARSGGAYGRYSGFVEVGRRFACTARESLRRGRNFHNDAVLFAYDTGALEVLEWAREKGIRCVVNQMDPNRIEVDLVRNEAGRWPGWELHPLEVPEEYFQRREREWELADSVVVNSEFCKQALVRHGVAAEKLVVIPLSYEVEEENREADGPDNMATGRKQTPGQPLRVLFLGQVILRKGIQYLMEAARKLEAENFSFEVVGPIGISQSAVASAPKNMKFYGRVNRVDARGWYRQADVFVLPTLSDGFAITQLEAMAHGLPVIATPCCGEVVSDGRDGNVVPARDANALASALHNLEKDRGLLREMSIQAGQKSLCFPLGRLASCLQAVETGLFQAERKPEILRAIP